MSPDAALAVLRRHLPSLEAAAMPTKCEVFTACGYEAAELRDAIEALSRRPDAPSAGEVAADVAIVRAVLHAYQRAMAPPDSGWGDMSYAKGSYDRLPQFQAALKAFRTAIRALPAPPQADGGEG